MLCGVSRRTLGSDEGAHALPRLLACGVVWPHSCRVPHCTMHLAAQACVYAHVPPAQPPLQLPATTALYCAVPLGTRVAHLAGQGDEQYGLDVLEGLNPGQDLVDVRILHAHAQRGADGGRRLQVQVRQLDMGSGHCTGSECSK